MTSTNLQQSAVWSGSAVVGRWKKNAFLLLAILYYVDICSYNKDVGFVSSFKMIDESYSLKHLKGGSNMTRKNKKPPLFRGRHDKNTLSISKSTTVAANVDVTKKLDNKVTPFSSDMSSLSVGSKQKEKEINSSTSFWLIPDTTAISSSRRMVDISASPPFRSIVLQRMHSFRTRIESLLSTIPVVPKVDLAIFATYAFSIVVNTIPTVCLPLMADDSAYATTTTLADPPTVVINSSGAFSANIASLCTLGGALGKFFNGFICQKFGGRFCTTTYLVVISILSMLLSRTSNHHGPIIAGMEFTQSIMWTACTVLLYNQYKNQSPKKFATAMTTLSLTSSSFVLFTKVLGMSILKYFHWRTLAQIGSLLAFSGATIMFLFGDDQQTEEQSNNEATISSANNNDKINILSSLQNVLGSKLFWVVGLSHGTMYLARGMDKILGSFYQDAAQLPAHIGSGMTSTVTLGFVYGLISGRKIQSLTSIEKKNDFLFSRYRKAILSALLLAGCANKSISSILGASTTALIVAIASGTMAANVSYQFYQFPAMISKSFGKDKAICISFIDGIAFFMAAPIWSLTGKIISNPIFGSHGWSMTWALFAVMLFIGGRVMLNITPCILSEKKCNCH